MNLQPKKMSQSDEPQGTNLDDFIGVAVSEQGWPEEEEPLGDDLSWAEHSPDNTQTEDWDAVVPEGEATDWEDPVQTASIEPCWEAFPSDPLSVIGAVAWVWVDAPRRRRVRAVMATLQQQTVLHTPDVDLLNMGTTPTQITLGGQTISIELSVVFGETEELVVGRDILSGRFVVDVSLPLGDGGHHP